MASPPPACLAHVPGAVGAHTRGEGGCGARRARWRGSLGGELSPRGRSKGGEAEGPKSWGLT